MAPADAGSRRRDRQETEGAALDFRMRRVYDPPGPDDGFRALVDRLWPRGVRRETLQIDAWWKDLTPSDELRRFYHGDRSRWPEFRRRYLAELDALPEDTVPAALAPVREPGRVERITLLTAVRELEQSHVPVLVEWLRSRLDS